MTMDSRTAKARRERKVRREAELQKINDVYCMEVLEGNEDKGKEEDSEYVREEGSYHDGHILFQMQEGRT